jgi:hypothetical protein
MSWSNFPVAEMMLVLVDDTHCESFRFASDGRVGATVGERDGALAAPVWHWQIVQDHLVITTRPGGEVVADLHQPTLDGDVLSVRRGATGACRYQVSWTPAAHTRVLP